MAWYTKSRAKRFINAFKEDAFEAFEAGVSEIRRLSENIRRGAQQGMYIESRTTNLMVEENRHDIKEMKEQIPAVYGMLDNIRRILLQELGRNGKSLCLSNAQVYCSKNAEDRSHELEGNDDLEMESERTLVPGGSESMFWYFIESLSDNSSHRKGHHEGKPNRLCEASSQTLGRMQESSLR